MIFRLEEITMDTYIPSNSTIIYEEFILSVCINNVAKIRIENEKSYKDLEEDLGIDNFSTFLKSHKIDNNCNYREIDIYPKDLNKFLILLVEKAIQKEKRFNLKISIKHISQNDLANIQTFMEQFQPRTNYIFEEYED